MRHWHVSPHTIAIAAAAAILVLSAAPAHAETPAERARHSIDAQLAAFAQGAAGRKAFLAMFDDDAVIVADGAATARELRGTLDDASSDTSQVLPRLFGKQTGGGYTPIKVQRLGKITAGGTADAVWWAFDLVRDGETLRVTELAVRHDATWKLALAHAWRPIADSWEDDEQSAGGGPLPWGAFPDGKSDGTLATLIGAPGQLGKALGKDPATLAIGTAPADLAIGPAAAARLVGGWAKLELDVLGGVERHAAGWGYAVGQVVLPAPKPGPHGKQSMKMRASVIALPEGNGWQVVAVHYTRVRW
jgi:hypothetical protein